MKKKKKHPRTLQSSAVSRTGSRQPLRKVKETADGGLLLDDRDADEPFLKPSSVSVKKVA